MDVDASLTGRLLVALPALADSNFDGSVVLMIEHRPGEGSIGIVLNRPSGLDVAEPLPEWDLVAVGPSVVFVGGPMAPDSAIGLARSDIVESGNGWQPLSNGLGTVDLERSPDEIGPGVQEVRVFAGYAGWSAGQLEGEIAAGAWVVVGAETSDALSTDPEGLWRKVLRRQPGRLAWLANLSPDPSLN